MENLQLSVIAPAYNEVDNVQPLVERIGQVFVPLNLRFEAIIVDDASTDGTRESCRCFPHSTSHHAFSHNPMIHCLHYVDRI